MAWLAPLSTCGQGAVVPKGIIYIYGLYAMVFDGLSMLNALWGFVCVMFTAPAFAGRQYSRVGLIALFILIANTILLNSMSEEALLGSISRSLIVAMLNVFGACLFAHFIYRKRSVSDLFRFRRSK